MLNVFCVCMKHVGSDQLTHGLLLVCISLSKKTKRMKMQVFWDVKLCIT